MRKGPIVGAGVGLLFLFLGVFAVTYLLVQRSSPKGSDGLREAVQEERKRGGEAVSRGVATAAVDYLLEPGQESDILLGKMVSRAKEGNKEVLYVLIADRNGNIVAHSDTLQVGKKLPLKGLNPLGSQPVLAQALTSQDGRSSYDVAVPVLVGDRKIGEVHTGILAPDLPQAPAQAPILPKLLFLGIAGIVVILVLTGVGVRSVQKAVPPEIAQAVARYPELKDEEDDLTRKIGQKREELFSLTKDLDGKRKEEDAVSKRLEEKKREGETLPKRTKEVEGQLAELKGAVSKTTEELTGLNQRVKAMKEEEQRLLGEEQKLKERLAQAAAASAAKLKSTSPEKIEAKKKEELELIQRIVGKRREEIAISQRIEAKRKEGIDLVRQIEALKKQLKSLEERRGG